MVSEIFPVVVSDQYAETIITIGDWGSPKGVQLFTHVFVDSACKQLTMALSQARNLLRPNNLSGDLTGGCVNKFMSFFE